MVSKVEELKNKQELNDVTDGLTSNTSISPNELVIDQAKLQEEKSSSHKKIEDNREPIPMYAKDNFFQSINNLFKSLISPRDSNSTFFKTGADKAGSGELIQFYIYHSILTLLFLFFSIYRLYEFLYNKVKVRLLTVAYNPNNDPAVINNDINKLPKIPQRLSAVLNYKSETEENGGIEGLCDDSSQIIAWCLSSGIPYLSIYEYHGILKKHIPDLRRLIYKKLVAYFGTENVPTFIIKIPHLNVSYTGSFDGEYDDGEDDDDNKIKHHDIEISLLSNVDGRPTIVELTKVMAELSKNGELKNSDITTKFLDQELRQLVGEEPDLIVLFQPYLNLQGYPPWQIRLSEMYWEPDNDSVSYAVYLRALQKYSTCKVNVGR